MTLLLDRERVTGAFDTASAYARVAKVQRCIAARLAERVAGLGLPADPQILEIGCGTGFLTKAAIDKGVGGQWTITDKAPGMVKRCEEFIGVEANRCFAVLDGEYGLEAVEGTYDLVCSSMAMQWFDDLAGAISRIMDRIAPGGHLLFNTLAEGTFAEWREAHRIAGHSTGALVFPPVSELRAVLSRFAPENFAVEHHVECHADAREFLVRLKLIGAATARRDHRPLPPAAFRKVLAEFDRASARVTYEVVTCHIVKREAA